MLPFPLQLVVLLLVAVGGGALMVGSVTLAMRAGLTGVLLDLSFLGGPFFALAWAYVALVAVARWFRGRHGLTVGADGVYVARRLSRQFIPHSSIRSLVREGRELVLDQRDQAPLRVRVPFRGDRSAVVARLDQLVDQFEKARAGYGKAGSLPPLKAMVASAQHCTPEWLELLRETTRREDYRESSVTADALWPVVEDAAIDPAERVAAAVALRPSLDAGGKSRLRIAAESTLSPRVRVALQAALDDDDVQLTRSFAELRGES